MLIDFGDPMPATVDHFEHYSIRIFMYLHIAALIYSRIFLYGVITASEVSPRFLWSFNDISEVFMKHLRFNDIRSTFIYCANKMEGAMVVWMEFDNNSKMRQSRSSMDRKRLNCIVGTYSAHRKLTMAFHT